MAQPTNFVESNALLAIIREEPDEAKEILRSMSVKELGDLSQAARTLRWMCDDLIFAIRRRQQSEQPGE